LSFPDFNSERARLAGYRRQGREETDPQVRETRRNLNEARLAEHIRRLVDEAPPLTAEQRDRLAILLRGGEAA
jgi:hypothetical protein